MILPHSHAPSTPPHLIPRAANSDGTTNSNLSNGAIIIIVLVAAGFSVLLGYSMTRFFHSKDDSDGLVANDEQVRYMREVRQRSAQSLGIDGYRPRGGDLLERDDREDENGAEEGLHSP
jgi:hypothetical protein